MKEDYANLFRLRGGKYDKAMRQFPNARDEEFIHAVAKVEIKPDTVVIDVPAGGGYLQRYLPANCTYYSHDPCESSFISSANSSSDLLPLPFNDNSIDVAFSIAGVHHISDKNALFKEMARVMSSKGQFVLVDVYKDSAVANFLDNFVGEYNSTGHTGEYLSEETITELTNCGWLIQSANKEPFYWQFDNKESMAEFCCALFDLRHINTEDIIDSIESMLGTTNHSAGVGMAWELLYVVAQKK